MTPESPASQLPHIPEDDLVLFTLQLLPDERMRQARQHLETCDLCRTDVAKLQGDLVAYSTTTEIQPPPPAARERLLRQVAKEPRIIVPEPVVAPPEPPPLPQRPPAERRAPIVREREPDEPMIPMRRSRGLRVEAQEDEPEETVERDDRRPATRAPWILAGVGWALAAAACFFAGVQLRQRQQIQNTIADQQAQLDDSAHKLQHAQDALAALTAANAMQVMLHSAAPAKLSTKGATPPAPAPEALAAYLADKGALIFIATHLEPAPAGKTYQLWVVPSDGRSPVPVGTFRPNADGDASIVMPRLPSGVPAKAFGVTVENDGGSATPTLPMVLSST